MNCDIPKQQNYYSDLQGNYQSVKSYEGNFSVLLLQGRSHTIPTICHSEKRAKRQEIFANQWLSEVRSEGGWLGRKEGVHGNYCIFCDTKRRIYIILVAFSLLGQNT